MRDIHEDLHTLCPPLSLPKIFEMLGIRDGSKYALLLEKLFEMRRSKKFSVFNSFLLPLKAILFFQYREAEAISSIMTKV